MILTYKEGIMSKIISLIFAVVCSFASCNVVFAHGPDCGEGLKNMLSSIKMDDSQREKVRPVLENLKSNLQQNALQMKDIEKQIWAQISGSSMDQTAINDLVDKKAKLIGDMMKSKIMAKGQIYALLTSEQKKMFQDKMQKVHESMEAQYKSCHE